MKSIVSQMRDLPLLLILPTLSSPAKMVRPVRMEPALPVIQDTG